MKKPICKLTVAAILTMACTNLEPTVYSDITMDALMADAAQSSGYMLSPIYGQMRWFNEDRSVWDLYELGTDAWVIPINTDGGWNDGGIWQRLNKHEWRVTDPHFAEVWDHLWYGISSCCNRVLYQLETAGVELDEATVAEIKVARAHYYYHLLSLFGNVPIETNFDVPDGYFPETHSRKEVYDFVVRELRENMDKLSEERTYSRFNKWAAKHMLARVYLNAESWLGPEYASKRDSTIILCDEIIASGKYSLDASYRHVFSLENNTSQEVIFAIPYDETTGTPILHCIYAKTMHYMGKPVYNANSAGYNGLRANPSFVENVFDAEENPVTHNLIPGTDKDKRYQATYLMGQQYDYVTGEPLYFDSAKKIPYNHINFIASPTAAEEFDGYRFGKYEIKIGQKWETDQDWVMYRYGETLMMKAECLLRAGQENDAAEIVNYVRKRSFDADLPEAERTLSGEQLAATVTVDGIPVKYGEFVNELGREFAGEGMRREILIRFGLYTTGSWWGHNPSGKDYLKLYPIPADERNSNPKLAQNDGYPN